MMIGFKRLMKQYEPLKGQAKKEYIATLTQLIESPKGGH